MPRGDLWSPPGEHAAEPADLGAVGAIVEGGGELFDPLQGEVGIPDLIDLADRLLRGPSISDMTLRVARGQQSAAPLTCVVVEAFVGHDQQPAGAEQRIDPPWV